MAKAPRKQKFLRDDKPEAAMQRHNEFVSDVVNCLSSGVSFSDNIAGVVKDITYLSTALPITVSFTSNAPPFAVWVMKASPAETTGASTSGNQVSWTWDKAGLVSVTDIANLTAGLRYNVKLAIVAE